MQIRGILSTPESTSAILEIHSGDSRFRYSVILREGERDMGVEVVRIDARAGQVTLKLGEEESVLALARNPAEEQAGMPPRTLDLKTAPLEAVLHVYQRLTDKTVLRSPLLATFPLTVRTGFGAGTAQAIEVLNQSLAREGVVMRPHRDKFMLALPTRQAAELPELPAPQNASAGDPIPAGLVTLLSAPLAHVIPIYEELSGRTVLRPTGLPKLSFDVRTQTDCTRSEVVHILDLLFRLGELTALQEGEKFVFLLPTSQTSRLKSITALRPAPNPPRPFALDHSNGPKAHMVRLQDAPLSQALEFYGSLAGLKPLSLPRTVPQVRLSLHNQTDLTTSETLYAIQAVAMLNGIQFVSQGEGQVTTVVFPPSGTNAPFQIPE
ncbi:MAG TPA: hypothetical protein PK640_19850 [Verrucomicrobiota bacterium]|nr:hypothetical protein [Verrucomicrobiota bacterium]